MKKPDAYKCLKQDLEYSAKIYGCSMHELHDPKLEYPEDIEKAAGQFSMSGEDFIGRFLEYDPGEMSYKTIHCPCDFLKDDGARALGDWVKVYWELCNLSCDECRWADWGAV